MSRNANHPKGVPATGQVLGKTRAEVLMRALKRPDREDAMAAVGIAKTTWFKKAKRPERMPADELKALALFLGKKHKCVFTVEDLLAKVA